MTPEELQVYKKQVQQYARLVGLVVGLSFCALPWLVCAAFPSIPRTDALLTVIIYLLFLLGVNRGK